jgi:pimeloyl-ACP methyl ester carboxylesterase
MIVGWPVGYTYYFRHFTSIIFSFTRKYWIFKRSFISIISKSAMKTLLFILSFCATSSLIAQNPEKIKDIDYPFKKVEYQNVGGINLAFVKEGKGVKNLVFIHGLGSYMPAWQNNITALAKVNTCYAIDLPGYGKSEKPDTVYSISFYADIIDAFIKEMKLENVYLVGHSMGGHISLYQALSSPKYLSGLVLIAPAGIETFTKNEAAFLQSAVTETSVAAADSLQISLNIRRNFYNYPASADFMISDRIKMKSAKDFGRYCEVVVDNIQGMLSQPVFNELSKLKFPVLVIFGREDQLIPNKYLHQSDTEQIIKTATKAIPDSKGVIIDEAGHFVHYEQYNKVNEVISSFLNGQN